MDPDKPYRWSADDMKLSSVEVGSALAASKKLPHYVVILRVSGAAQVGQLGHAGQFDAAAFAITDAFGHGESFGYSAAVHTTPAMNEANMLIRHRWSVRSR